MTADKLIDRVRKLLALAESPNENEAALAAEKAQELMLQYGIELAQVAAAKGQMPGVSHEVFRGGLDPWRTQLAQAVATALGGEFVMRREYRKWTGDLEFWGERGTVPSMIALYQYLEDQLVAVSAIEAGRHRGEFANAAQSTRWRRSFLWGAALRVSERLQARTRKTEQEGDNSKALVVIRGAVDRALEEQYPNMREARSKVSYDPEAAARGHQAGSDVDLGDKKVGKGRGALPTAN